MHGGGGRSGTDILILDLSMPELGGLETIHRLQKIKDKPAILVLSAKDDELSVNEALEAGAKGFIPKTADSEELLFAVRSISKGQTYVSPAVAKGLLNREGDAPGTTSIGLLSMREREVMKLLAEGHPNREVAKMLHISPRTIDSHRSNIMKKLGISSNAELVQMAVKYGLVE